MAILEENPEPFNVHSEQRGSAVLMHLSGELDMATAPALEGWLSGAERNGNAEIVVDLNNVTFMDSTGLRPFLEAATRARRNGRSFALVRAPAQVARVLQITRTAHLLVEPSAATEQTPEPSEGP
jgi:anti-anti-sigma factor